MHNLFNQRRVLALVAFLLFTSLAVAATTTTLAPILQAHLSGSVTREGRTVKLEDAGKVSPGEHINWNITLVNSGDAAASNVQPVGQIPQGTQFVPGSTTGDATSVQYSLDGKTFSPVPMVSVIEKGVTVQRPASPDQYKAVQFTFALVGKGETKYAAYSTRVR